MPHSPAADAFEQLYHAQRERVFALCLRLSGDRVRAAELLQDVFVRIWEQYGALRDQQDAGAWVYRVTLNTVFNIRRGDRRRSARIALAGDVAATDVLPDPGNASPFATPAPIRRLALDDGIATLASREREIFVLHDVEGFSTDDIGALLRIAPSTVRVHLARARRHLREYLSV